MTASSIEHRHLRSALEFAVSMAREGRKLKPPLKYPRALDKYMKQTRIPSASLPAVRRIVEGDERFRAGLALGALPELVDPIGKVWLERSPGWEDELRRLVDEADAAAEAADTAKELKRAEKRRDAAEIAAARTRAELVTLTEQVAERDATIAELNAELAATAEALASVRAELVESRTEARHARDRATAAAKKLSELDAAHEAAIAAQNRAELVRDDVLAERVGSVAERSELGRLAAAAEALARQLGALASPAAEAAGAATATKRQALPLPGGVLGDSAVAAEYLLRSGASVLIDGYNVAKLGWPNLPLSDQRAASLDAIENAVRRFGCDITVVFDGADVVGATADRRRVVRVVFSPPDVIADDVIRDEVRRLPATRSVVVVTNDQEIVRDVRAMGANTLASSQFLAVIR